MKAVEIVLHEYDEILRLLESDKGPMQAARRNLLAKALNAKALMHREIGDLETTIAVCDAIMRRFGTGVEPALREAVAQAMGVKAHALESSRRFDEAVRAWGEAAEYASSSDTRVDRERAAAALVNKAIVERQLDRHENAIETCDEVTRRFGAEHGENFQERVAAALVVKANAKGAAGDPAATIAVCDEVVERFGAIDNPAVRKQVTAALLAMACAQAETGQAGAALRTCDDVERRLSELTENDRVRIGRFVFWARTKAFLIQEERAAAVDAYRSALATYKFSDDEELSEFLFFTAEAVAGGAPVSELLEALDAHGESSARLAPLLVALHRRAGSAVRAPAEVVAVADRVDRMIEERKRAALKARVQ